MKKPKDAAPAPAPDSPTNGSASKNDEATARLQAEMNEHKVRVYDLIAIEEQCRTERSARNNRIAEIAKQLGGLDRAVPPPPKPSRAARRRAMRQEAARAPGG